MRLVNPAPTVMPAPEVELVDLMTAATRLGISYDGVRRRIARGKLRSIKREGHVLVFVPPAEPDRTPPDSTPDTVPNTPPNSPPDSTEQPAGHPPDGPLRELVETLREENRRLWAELEVRTEELRRKDHIIAALTQRPPALFAGSPQPVSDQPIPEPLHVRRSLWRRLLAALAEAP